MPRSCDLLENLYLCGISNNPIPLLWYIRGVVICLKICTFVVSATTSTPRCIDAVRVVICLKICTFVVSATTSCILYCLTLCCDLLENLYLCGISNNFTRAHIATHAVVICLKICTFVVSATTYRFKCCLYLML